MANTVTSASMESSYHEEDDEDKAVDDAAHEKLLNSLFAMDGKKRNKNNVRGISMPSGNLDLVVHAKKDEGKIKPQDLKLKARDASASLKKPMNSMETEQIKRQIARETINSEMTAWEPVVQEIRSAPQTIFSKRPHGVEMREAMKPKGFTPRTPLEKELFAALGQSEDVLNPNKELTMAEERALKAMSVKEAMERRAELMKHHELLSRAQVRAKRVKKIKSKRYRKILRKEKEGAERKELEKLQQTDPEAFVDRLEQLEKDRMEERLTLKHRGGGKFARLHKVYSKFDDKTREAMQDMLQKSRELTKKTESISDEEDEEEDIEMVQDKSSEVPSDNDNEEESSSKNTSLKTSQLDILKAINKKAGGWLGGPKSIYVYANEQPTNSEGEVQTEEASEKPQVNSPLREAESSPNEVGGDKSLENNQSEEESGSGSRKKRKLDLPESETGGDDNAASEPKKKRRKRNKKKARAVDDKDDEDADAKNPGKVKKKPVVEVTLQIPAEAEASKDEDDEDDGEEDNDALKVTMEELFQDEDVVEEFAREKAAAEAKARPKIEDTRLPGWGSWAGPDYKGEKPLTKKQKKAEARAKQLEKQQQKVKQPHVWLNPNRDDAIRKLQPKGVPFPFSSVQQYEASLRQPVSRGFVTETAFKLLNKPEVVTKLGHIITPLDKEDVFQKKNESGDVGVENGTLASKKGNYNNSRDSKNGGFRRGGNKGRESVRQSNVSESWGETVGLKNKQKRRGVS